MKTPLKYTLIITSLLILAALTLAACSLPIQGTQTTQHEVAEPDTASDETSAPLVDPTSIPTSDENIQEEIVPGEDEEIEAAEAEVDLDSADGLGMSTLSVNTDEGSAGITETETASLIYMREEEKLAHDVYLALYDLWGLPLFQNIARSEESHTNAVKQLLDIFNIPDPADTSPPGVFVNPDLQTLFDDLVAMGERSLADALKVGGAIEEIDILDLQESIAETQNPEILRVYENLLRGSENHLRAFTSTLLQQTAETYIPQYMDASAYDAILASAPGRGGRNNNRRP